MKANTAFLMIFVIAAAIVFAVSYTGSKEKENEQRIIEQYVTSFDKCVNVGYPILESYPRQCKTPDGRVFIEQIEIGSDSNIILPQTQDYINEPECRDMCGDGMCQEVVCMATGCPCPEDMKNCPDDCA